MTQTTGNVDPKARALARIRGDKGPFYALGNRFWCQRGNWIGPAVASPTAIYLLKIGRQNSDYAFLGFFAWFNDDHLGVCNAADLPGHIWAALDPQMNHRHKSVVIIPKSTVSRVSAPKGNAITITSGDFKIGIITGMIKQSEAAKKLEDFGWSLNTPLTPSKTPLLDLRTPELIAASKRQRKIALWAIIPFLLLILAAGITVLVIGYQHQFAASR